MPRAARRPLRHRRKTDDRRETTAAPRTKEPDHGAGQQPATTPAARRLLEERGLNPADVAATGPGGRLLQGRCAEAHSIARRRHDHCAAGEKTRRASTTPTGERGEEVVPMSPIRRRIAERLVEAQHNAALLTTFNEIDMSAVMQLRAEHKERLPREVPRQLGLHVVLRESRHRCPDAVPGDQCRSARHRHRLSQLLRHRHRGRQRKRAWWSPCFATPSE